jgi:H+/Cl- antiporter ClcA
MKDNAVGNLRRRDTFKYAIVGEGVIIGLITGALISVFRLMLMGADVLRDRMVEYAAGGAARAALAAVILLCIAGVISVLLGWEPEIAGSGIPQVEAELKGQKDMRWLRVIIGKVAGCALAIGGGLALGREGPSIQLGAMVGKGVSRAGHRLLTEERLLITCGAGAGLSAAFGAPLAGAIFSLEELHRNFSAEVLLSTMAASAASEFVAANVFGLTPVFGFEAQHGLPLYQYWAVILLGIILGFFGILYNRTIAFRQDLFDRAGLMWARIADHIPSVSAFNLTDSKLNITGEKVAKLG